jgi:hypothetical protein
MLGDPAERGARRLAALRRHELAERGTLGQGCIIKAEPLVVAGYEGRKAREARISMPDRFRLSDAAGRVVQLYEAWRKPD